MLARGALALMVLLGLSGVAAADRVGVAAAVRGEVSVSGRGDRQAKSGDDMFLGDKVATRKTSGMQILLLDETTFTIGENCSLVIDRFVYDPNKGTGKVAATLGRGTLRYVSGLISRNSPNSVSLKTPIATIGARGTMADVVVGTDAIKLAQLQGLDTNGADKDDATLVVLRGPGDNRNSLDRRGDVNVQSGGGSVDLDAAGLLTFIKSANDVPAEPELIKGDVERALTAGLRNGVRTASNNTRSGGTNGDPGTSSGQSAMEGKPFATDTSTTPIDKTTTPGKEPDPIPVLPSSGIVNNIGREVATYDMARYMPGTRTFSQTGAKLYEAGTPGLPGSRYGNGSSINVGSPDPSLAKGSYNFSVTVTPGASAATVSMNFSNITATDPAYGLSGASISSTNVTGSSSARAFYNFSTNQTGGCVGRCDGAVDLLGSPTTLINGATHSLIINQAGGAPGALQGTGVTDP